MDDRIGSEAERVADLGSLLFQATSGLQPFHLKTGVARTCHLPDQGVVASSKRFVERFVGRKRKISCFRPNEHKPTRYKWRRGGDSNPRYGITAHSLSRRAP